MSENVWEVSDADGAEVMCADCAHQEILSRGYEHTLGLNFKDEDADFYATEDVFNQHSECEHTCYCGKTLGLED